MRKRVVFKTSIEGVEPESFPIFLVEVEGVCEIAFFKSQNIRLLTLSAMDFYTRHCVRLDKYMGDLNRADEWALNRSFVYWDPYELFCLLEAANVLPLGVMLLSVEEFITQYPTIRPVVHSYLQFVLREILKKEFVSYKTCVSQGFEFNRDGKDEARVWSVISSLSPGERIDFIDGISELYI